MILKITWNCTQLEHLCTILSYLHQGTFKPSEVLLSTTENALRHQSLSFYTEYILKVLDMPKSDKCGLNSCIWKYFILQSLWVDMVVGNLVWRRSCWCCMSNPPLKTWSEKFLSYFLYWESAICSFFLQWKQGLTSCIFLVKDKVCYSFGGFSSAKVEWNEGKKIFQLERTNKDHLVQKPDQFRAEHKLKCGVKGIVQMFLKHWNWPALKEASSNTSVGPASKITWGNFWISLWWTWHTKTCLLNLSLLQLSQLQDLFVGGVIQCL